MARKTVAEIKNEAYHKGHFEGYQMAVAQNKRDAAAAKAEADLEMLKAATELMKQAGMAMSKAGYLALAVRKGNTNF